MRKAITITVVVVLIVAGLGYLGLRRIQQTTTQAQSNLQTAEVRRGSLVATVTTAGTVDAADALNLVFQSTGTVKEIRVKEGDAVKAGTVIACLDDTDAKLQVAQAEANLASAQARLEQAKQGATPEDIAAAKAALASAQENLKKLQAGPSARDVEIARLRYEQAKDQLWSAQLQRDNTVRSPGANEITKAAANASVAAAEVSVEIARLQYEAAQEGPSAADLRAAESQVAQAQAKLASLLKGPDPQEIRIAQSAVDQANVALQQAKNKLAQLCLTAPFDGTITHLGLQVGQFVGSGSSATVAIAKLNSLEVNADMSEIDVAKVKVGQEANVTLDALPDSTFKGHVTAIAITGTSTQGVVNYTVTIGLDQTDPRMKPGMTASASIIVDRRDNVLLAPSRAIRTQGNQYLVRVLYQGQIIDTPVQVGLSGDNGTEILGDTLKEGDVLVLNTPTTTERRVGIGGPMMIPR